MYPTYYCLTGSTLTIQEGGGTGSCERADEIQLCMGSRQVPAEG